MTNRPSEAAGQETGDRTATANQEIPAHESPTGTSRRPMTGEEYIESIRDGREIYLYGDRVTPGPT